MSDGTLAVASGPTSEPRIVREYLKLVRELSFQRRPEDLINTYRARSQFVVRFDDSVSLSRVGMPPGRVRITRSTRWSNPPDPWRERDLHPVVDSGLLVQLVEAGVPAKMDRVELEPDDPAHEHLGPVRCLLASPIFHEGRADHMVVMVRRDGHPFTWEELATFLLTSNLVGQATWQLVLSQELQRAYAALDHEFRVIGEIQRQLLPRQAPQIPGVDIAAHYETSTQAGGDYYDFLALPEGRHGLLIADVSGHGAPAAVVMAMVHALVKAPMQTCPFAATSPLEVLRNLNASLSGSVSPGQFVTVFYGVLDATTRRLTYASAGHNMPRLARGGQVRGLPGAAGYPLAVASSLEGSEEQIALRPGDRLLLYTDGVTETFNADGEMYGTERLDRALRRGTGSAQAILAGMLADLRAFCGDVPPRDDRTLVLLEFS